MNQSSGTTRTGLPRGGKLYWKPEHHAIVVKGLREKKTYNVIAERLREAPEGRPVADGNHVYNIIHCSRHKEAIPGYLRDHGLTNEAEIAAIDAHYQMPGTKNRMPVSETPRVPYVRKKQEGYVAPPMPVLDPVGDRDKLKDRLFDGMTRGEILSDIASKDEHAVMAKIIQKTGGVMAFLEHRGLSRVEAQTLADWFSPDAFY